MPESQGLHPTPDHTSVLPHGSRASLEMKRNELSPTVRSYADNLATQIRDILALYNITNVEELHHIASQRNTPLTEEHFTRLQKLMTLLQRTKETGELPKEEAALAALLEMASDTYDIEVSEQNLKTGQEYIDEIRARGMEVWDSSKRMLTKGTITQGEHQGKTFDQVIGIRIKEIQKLGKPETLNLVCLTVNALFGDNQKHTTEQIWKKATELGLELCPIETGPLLRLAIGKDQPREKDWSVAHEPIGSGDLSNVFTLYCGVGGVVLSDNWADTNIRWGPDDVLVFRLRKSL